MASTGQQEVPLRSFTHTIQSLEPLLAWLESCVKGRPLVGTPEGLVLVENARALPGELEVWIRSDSAVK